MAGAARKATISVIIKGNGATIMGGDKKSASGSQVRQVEVSSSSLFKSREDALYEFVPKESAKKNLSAAKNLRDTFLKHHVRTYAELTGIAATIEQYAQEARKPYLLKDLSPKKQDEIRIESQLILIKSRYFYLQTLSSCKMATDDVEKITKKYGDDFIPNQQKSYFSSFLEGIYNILIAAYSDEHFPQLSKEEKNSFKTKAIDCYKQFLQLLENHNTNLNKDDFLSAFDTTYTKTMDLMIPPILQQASRYGIGFDAETTKLIQRKTIIVNLVKKLLEDCHSKVVLAALPYSSAMALLA